MTPCGPSPPAIRPATAVPWKSATAPWPAWLGACSTSSGPVSATPLSTTATVTFRPASSPWRRRGRAPRRCGGDPGLPARVTAPGGFSSSACEHVGLVRRPGRRHDSERDRRGDQQAREHRRHPGQHVAPGAGLGSQSAASRDRGTPRRTARSSCRARPGAGRRVAELVGRVGADERVGLALGVDQDGRPSLAVGPSAREHVGTAARLDALVLVGRATTDEPEPETSGCSSTRLARAPRRAVGPRFGVEDRARGLVDQVRQAVGQWFRRVRRAGPARRAGPVGGDLAGLLREVAVDGGREVGERHRPARGDERSSRRPTRGRRRSGRRRGCPCRSPPLGRRGRRAPPARSWRSPGPHPRGTAKPLLADLDRTVGGRAETQLVQDVVARRGIRREQVAVGRAESWSSSLLGHRDHVVPALVQDRRTRRVRRRRTPGCSVIVTRTPRSFVGAGGPAGRRSAGRARARLAGAPRMPMSSPIVCSSIVSCGTMRGSTVGAEDQLGRGDVDDRPQHGVAARPRG